MFSKKEWAFMPIDLNNFIFNLNPNFALIITNLLDFNLSRSNNKHFIRLQI